VHKIFAPFFQGGNSYLVNLLHLSDLVGFILRWIMQLLLIPVKNSKHYLFKLHKEGVLHFVGNLIQKASNVFMLIEIVEEPSQPLIDTHDIVMQIIKTPTVIVRQLLYKFFDESLILLQIVKRVNDLLNVQVDVRVIVFISDGVNDAVLSLSIF
jgi:hypothetical protein